MIKLSQFVIAILSSLSIISCSKNNDVLTIEDEGNNDSELPTQIKSNTIIYKTNDNIILRFENEDVFGGAKIISNLYSTSQGCGTITFGSEVTAIEKSAFEHFENLTDIILPNTVATIGEDAFNDCNNLSNIYIPSSVRKIGKNAFSCFGIESVHIENLGAWCEIEFATCQSNPLHDKDCRLYIDGKIIQKLNIPNSVRSIKIMHFTIAILLTLIFQTR